MILTNSWQNEPSSDGFDETLSPVTTLPGKLTRESGLLHDSRMFLTNSSQNKSLSDIVDEIMKLEGVSDQIRTAIADVSVTLEHGRYIDDAGEHIDIKQRQSGGSDARVNSYVLDNEKYFNDHDLIGPLFAKRRTRD
jgi:hypothetical protein